MPDRYGSHPPLRRVRSSTSHDKWLAAVLALVAVVILSNSLWFYNWRVRAVAHHEEVEALRREHARERADMVASIDVMPQLRSGPRQAPVSANARRGMRQPIAGEECRGGVIFRRNGNMLESSGERCGY
ncbi:hypothetical protein [Luteimonas sp. e5]